MIGIRQALLALLLVLAGCDDKPAPGSSAEQVSPRQTAEWPLVWRYENGSCQNTETRVLVERSRAVQASMECLWVVRINMQL